MRTYFDYNATAPLDPEVYEAMEPFLRSRHGNAASRHEEGRSAHDAVERARAQIATAINAQPADVFFTSSGTESNNMIIKGIATRQPATRIVTSGIEHPCVLCAARTMAQRGNSFLPVGVDAQGLLDFDDLAASIAGPEPVLVSVMLANNESGVIQDVARVAAVGHAAGAVVHSDAAQALGKIAVDFKALDVDALTLSGHKARGPMGIAALVVKPEVAYDPLLDGGGQERGMRSGTLNVAGIVGFGKAAELAHARVQRDQAYLAGLQRTLEGLLTESGAVVFSEGALRLPNTSYFGFPNIEGEALVVMLDQAGFAVTSGSACASTKNEPSHVLLAMGLSETTARTAVRVSLGRENNVDKIQQFAATIRDLAERLGQMAAVSGWPQES